MTRSAVKKRLGFVAPSPRIAVMTALALVAAGCAPTLEQVQPTVSAELGRARPRSIAVLPVDLMIEADDLDGGGLSHQRTVVSNAKATPVVAAALHRALAERGYRAVDVAWDGTVAARPAIPPEVLANLADWMMVAGERAAAGHLPDGELGGSLPYFGTDATLYVGGVGHLHEDESHRAKTAKEVAAGIGIGLLVAVLIVGIVLLAAKGGGGGLGNLGGAAAALGKVAEASAKLAVAGLRIGAEVALRAPRLVEAAWYVPAHVEGPACNPYASVHDGYVVGPRAPAPELPPSEANFLQLGAVLVDNATGRVLWSAAQAMPIDPVDERELAQATAHVLQALPTPN